MAERIGESRDLLNRARDGDGGALGELLAVHRDRLHRMLGLRLTRRLQGRIDASDVLQEAYMEAVQRFPEYAVGPPMSFYLWLRFLASQQLLIHFRRHVGAKARDAEREIPLENMKLPEVDSGILAGEIVGSYTSPSQAAMRAEMQSRVHLALDGMDPMDREVLALRHFEQLNNSEVAHLLDLKESAASRRYSRALWRLKDILSQARRESEKSHEG